MDGPTLCFACGMPVTTPPRLNDMPDGSPCRTCRERALDLVPAPRPKRAPELDPEEEPEHEHGFLPAEQPFDPRDLGDDFPEPA